jgi:hypothetical protein
LLFLPGTIERKSMYSALPRTGAGLTVGGVVLSALDLMWIGIAIAVIGAAVLTLSKLFPRVAVDAVPVGVDGGRLQLTVSGRPVGGEVGAETSRFDVPARFVPAAAVDPIAEHGRCAGCGGETCVCGTAPGSWPPGRHRVENVATQRYDLAELHRRLNRDPAGGSFR